MRGATSVLGMMAFVAASPSVTQAPRAAKSESSGEQLADLLDPIDLLLAMDGRLFRQSIEAMVKQQPELAVMAQKQPKQLEAMLDAGQKAEGTILRDEYPAEQVRVGAMFDQALKQSDFDTLLTYYRSPLGKKVVALGFANMNRAGSTPAAIRQDEMENTARVSMVSQLSPEERQEMAAFAQTPAVRHFEPANAERRRMRAAWAHALTPQIQHDTGAAMDVAVAQYNAHPGNAR